MLDGYTAKLSFTIALYFFQISAFVIVGQELLFPLTASSSYTELFHAFSFFFRDENKSIKPLADQGQIERGYHWHTSDCSGAEEESSLELYGLRAGGLDLDLYYIRCIISVINRTVMNTSVIFSTQILVLGKFLGQQGIIARFLTHQSRLGARSAEVGKSKSESDAL